MNKTKMLRLSRNSALLFAAVSGALYLTACSSEDGLGPDQNVPEASLDTDSYSVHAPNKSRVHNYGGESTRAGEFVDAVDSFTMPDCPAVPVGTFDISTLEYGWMVDRDHKGENLWLPAGKTFGQFAMSATYYVEGTLDFSAGFNGVAPGSVVYVLPGGTFKMGATLDPNLTVYNYGTVEIANGLTISGKLYSATDIDATGEVGVDGELFCKGSITADNVRLNGNAIACAFIADNKITFNGQGTFKTSYFKAKEAELNTGYVELDDNGLMVTDVLFITNEHTRFTVNGTNAVVAAKTFYTNNVTWPKATFAPEIALDFKECKIGNQYYATDVNFNDFEFTVSYEGRTIFVPAAGCHGAYPEPGTPGQPVVEIQKVTDIDPIEEPNHDHGVISATCITFAGNTAYASYHLRGEGQKGCIEVFNDNGNGGIALGSYMIAPNYDFNHLIVDGNNIITVGNTGNKGAFIGSLPVDFTASENATRDDFKVKQLTTNEVVYETSQKDSTQQIKAGYAGAGDGNCVVRQGDYYYVATYKGYGPLNLDFSKVKNAAGEVVFTRTNGSAKHIAINGGKAAVLALDSYDETSSSASVKTFDASDYTFSNALANYDNIGTVAPVDGKNVVAVDGDAVYACLSTGGLVRLNDGKKFQRGEKGNVPVNGMAFDDKYVYVANGSFVSVLDKTDLHEVCYYHAASAKSANFIALHNGKIYVAFGEDGVQVYQLVEKTISE